MLFSELMQMNFIIRESWKSESQHDGSAESYGERGIQNFSHTFGKRFSVSEDGKFTTTRKRIFEMKIPFLKGTDVLSFQNGRNDHEI